MPGSFLSHDELLAQIDNEVFHNPWEAAHGIADPITTLERIQELVASATENEQPELRWDVVDWRKFEPPAALRKTPHVTSQVLLDIVQSSIERVRESVRNERRQELMAEEQRLLQELETRKAKQKGKEPYLPIIMVEDEPVPGNSLSEDPRSSHDGPSLHTTHSNDTVASLASDDASFHSLPTSGLVVLPGSHKLHKSRESAIRRLFKRNTEKGESSAEGSAREGLLQRLLDTRAANSSKSADQKTTDAVAKLKRRLKSVQEPEALL
jgi:hypothetical protein